MEKKRGGKGAAERKDCRLDRKYWIVAGKLWKNGSLGR